MSENRLFPGETLNRGTTVQCREPLHRQHRHPQTGRDETAGFRGFRLFARLGCPSLTGLSWGRFGPDLDPIWTAGARAARRRIPASTSADHDPKPAGRIRVTGAAARRHQPLTACVWDLGRLHAGGPCDAVECPNRATRTVQIAVGDVQSLALVCDRHYAELLPTRAAFAAKEAT